MSSSSPFRGHPIEKLSYHPPWWGRCVVDCEGGMLDWLWYFEGNLLHQKIIMRDFASDDKIATGHKWVQAYQDWFMVIFLGICPDRFVFQCLVLCSLLSCFSFNDERRSPKIKKQLHRQAMMMMMILIIIIDRSNSLLL